MPVTSCATNGKLRGKIDPSVAMLEDVYVCGTEGGDLYAPGPRFHEGCKVPVYPGCGSACKGDGENVVCLKIAR